MKCSPYSGQLSAKRSSNIKHKLFLEFAVFHALLQWLQFLLKERNLCIVMSNQVGVAVINLASHHCDPGSILGWYAGCDWLISIWLEGLSPCCPVFLPPQKSCFRRLPQNPCLVAGLYLKKFTRFDGYLYFIFSCHEFNITHNKILRIKFICIWVTHELRLLNIGRFLWTFYMFFFPERSHNLWPKSIISKHSWEVDKQSEISTNIAISSHKTQLYDDCNSFTDYSFFLLWIEPCY